MRRKIWTGAWTLAALLASVLLVAGMQTAKATTQQQEQQQAPGTLQHQEQPQQSPRTLELGPEHFTAVAANLGRTHGPLATQVELDIKRWTTDGERNELLEALRTKGQQALLDALQKQPVVGTIRTPDSLAYDLHYARALAWDDGGQQVVLATDRYITFWEEANAARSLDYPFTLIQMRVNGNGKGEGKMSLATRVIAAGNQIVLENYDTQPVLLTDVTLEKK